jgi:hypothetical protein
MTRSGERSVKETPERSEQDETRKRIRLPEDLIELEDGATVGAGSPRHQRPPLETRPRQQYPQSLASSLVRSSATECYRIGLVDVDVAFEGVLQAEEAFDVAALALEKATQKLREAFWCPAAIEWRTKNSIWREMNGVETRYADLDDEHLRNVVSFIRHRWNSEQAYGSKKDHPALAGILKEAKSRGMKDLDLL